MTVLKNFAFGLFVVVAALIVGGFALPDTVQVERETRIKAPPATVFTVLNSYTLFNLWSPWAGLDPKTVYSFNGPQRGVGAKFSWSSENPSVGAGSQEIIESLPYSLVRMQLMFSGFDTDNTASFTLTPQGGGTHVVWDYQTSFKGSLLLRYFGLVMDRMIGPDYERGLAQLKTFVESLPEADFSDLTVDTLDMQPTDIAYVEIESERNSQALGEVLDEAYKKHLLPFLKARGLKQAGAPLTVYEACSDQDEHCRLRAGMPVDRIDVAPSSDGTIQFGQIPGGKAVRATHTGSYQSLGATHAALQAYLMASGYEVAGETWEQYANDPTKTPEAELVTYLFVPIK